MTKDKINFKCTLELREHDLIRLLKIKDKLGASFTLADAIRSCIHNECLRIESEQ